MEAGTERGQGSNKTVVPQDELEEGQNKDAKKLIDQETYIFKGIKRGVEISKSKIGKLLL